MVTPLRSIDEIQLGLLPPPSIQTLKPREVFASSANDRRTPVVAWRVRSHLRA
jgi:hypothetical protein